MKKRNLVKKTFTTKDVDGCEFKCTAYYNHNENTAIYTFGKQGRHSATSLKELQEKVSKL